MKTLGTEPLCRPIKKVKECASYLWKSISQLRSVTCRMGSYSVTCHPTQANTPRLYPSPTGWYSEGTQRWRRGI